MTLEAEVMMQKLEGSDEQSAVEFIWQENREANRVHGTGKSLRKSRSWSALDDHSIALGR